METRQYEIAVVGCGVVGAAIARQLSQYQLSVCILEKENDVAVGTTKANSAIIHAGYDPRPGSLMAKLNARGVELVKEYQSQGIFVTLVGGIIDQCIEKGVKLGFNVRCVALGHELSSVAHVVSVALRAAIDDYLEKTGQDNPFKARVARIICECKGITDVQIEELVKSGKCLTFDQLSAETGCSTVCGKCRGEIISTLEELKHIYGKD